ncbi:hypothetical protein QE152_g33450 [Popillia japonica]|uniref:Transposase n=1 Tax=Popillia japonica TaxID=7064 RepID=A0AAW1IXJ6_POPJA
MWNLYQRTIDREERTNNHAEAANRRLRSELGMHHPTIWKYIDGLRKVQKGRDAYFEQLIAGHLPPMKLKKYRDADERIRRIVLDYGNRDPLDQGSATRCPRAPGCPAFKYLNSLRIFFGSQCKADIIGHFCFSRRYYNF